MAIFTSRHKTSGGSYNSGILNVTANGIYNASDNGLDGFNSVSVFVEPTNVLPVKTITSNGRYMPWLEGYECYGIVEVNVPIPTYNSAILNVNENGVYNAITAGYDGYREVNVQVPSEEPLTFNDNNGIGFLAWFNQPITIAQNVTNYRNLYAGLEAFNQPVTIPNYVSDCSYMFLYTAFNRELEIPESVDNCAWMFYYSAFNQDITLPYTLRTFWGGLQGCVAFGKNVYFDKPTISHKNMFSGCNNSLQKNIFANLSSFAYQGTGDIVGGVSLTWESITNGYRNTAYNIYLYNNYLGMLTDQSYYQRFQDNQTFDLAIKTANTVQNMAFALSGCSNFNNTVMINDSITDCGSMLNCCYNFNSPISIGNGVTNMARMFRNAYAFNQPITIPSNVTNCSVLLQGTAFNHPLTIPDSVTNCKWMLYNCVNFNSPLTIGNNVTDCQQMLEAYYYDDTNEKDVYGGGIFNQPIVFPKSVALANYALAGQQNMKSDIVLHNNNCRYSWFLGNAHYEGNIYCPNGILLTRINSMFASKDNTSGIASIYTPQSYSEFNDAIRNYKPTGNTDTWIGDETNSLVYSPTANIYIHCNWNGVIPSNNNYSSVVNAIQINSYYYGQDSDRGCQLWVTTGTYDGKSFTANAAPNMVLSYPGTTGADGYKDSIINVGQTWATSEWIGTAMGNITDGTNNYSAGNGVFAWNIYTAYHSTTLWER